MIGAAWRMSTGKSCWINVAASTAVYNQQGISRC